MERAKTTTLFARSVPSRAFHF